MMSSNSGQTADAGGPVRRVLALVIDFNTTPGAENLTSQLAEAETRGLEVVTVHVDNGNSEPVSLSARQEQLGVRLVRNRHNGGYAAGIRGAIAQITATGEHFDAYWFLNSDLEVEPDCLPRLVDVLRTHPRVAALGPNVFKGRTTQVWGARGVVSPWLGTTAMTSYSRGGVLPRWSYVPGCALLVRASAYEDVGGIPDRYGMYYEEAELCIRLQQSGWELWVEPEARAYHAVDSMKRGIPARYQAFYFTRNNLYFWKRNFGIPGAVQLPRTLFVVFKDLVLPLRRASSLREAGDRLRFIGMGLCDAFSFGRRRYTYFERKHFDLEPNRSAGPAR